MASDKDLGLVQRGWGQDQRPDAQGNTTNWNPAAYGGSSGKYDAQGRLISTPQQDDVARDQSIGQGMQGRQGYQFDWSNANQAHDQGTKDALVQGDANNTWRDQATGKDRTAYNYGKSLLDRGAQNQQAGALSTSGGPLAQVGASGRAANAQSGFMQKGTQELEAQHADDMAAGRAGWSAGLGQQRKLDQTGQALSDQQSGMEADAAAQQRALNDAGQYGMDSNALGTQESALAGQNAADDTAQQVGNAKQAHDDATDNRVQGVMNAGGSLVGGALGGPLGAAAGGGIMKGLGSIFSDERVKNKQSAGALLRMMRRNADMRRAEESRVDHAGEEENRSSAKPLLASMEKPKAEERNRSIYLPSDDIAETARLARLEPKSDEHGSTPAMTGYDRSMFSKTDDGTTPDKEALDAGIDKRMSRYDDPKLDPDARQYDPLNERTYNSGPQKAPKGYAKSRRGSAGAIDGSGPKATYDLGFGSGSSADMGGAPGTRDVLKYGTPSKRSEDNEDDYSKAVSISDERAKNKVETPEEKKGREDKEDAEETARFMGTPDSTTTHAPSSYEERSRAIDERNAQDRQIAADEKRRIEAPAIEYIDKVDEKNKAEAAKIRSVPVLGALAQRLAEHHGETGDQKVQRSIDSKKNEKTIAHARARMDEAATRNVEHLSPVSMAQFNKLDAGYRPALDERQRQPQTFTRGDENDMSRRPVMRYGESISDEEAKDKIDYANPKAIKSLGNDPDGTERRWDSDVSQAKETPKGASLSGPAPKYSSAPKEVPSAAKPAPGARKTRKYTDAELEKMGNEMKGSVQEQSDAQLGAGASVRDPKDSPKWLDDYMTSDEGAKNKGYSSDKGAGGGERESDGTTMEHRSNPLIEMQKHANRQLRGETYTYKEGFGEDPSRPHHGFMAQNLETNPITATAVREDPSGIKKVDNEDALRVTAAGVASLQEQHDELEAAVDALAARRGKKRVA